MEFPKFLGGKGKSAEEIPVVPENAPAQDLSGLEGIRPKNIVLRTESEVVDHEVEEAQLSIIEEPAGPAPILPSKTEQQVTLPEKGAQEASHVPAHVKPVESLVDKVNGGTPTMTTLGEHQEKNGTVSVEESATESNLNGHTPSWAKPVMESSSEDGVLSDGSVSVNKEFVTLLEHPSSASEKSAKADMESLKGIREKIASTNNAPEINSPTTPDIDTIVQDNKKANKIMRAVVDGLEAGSEKQPVETEKVSTTKVDVAKDSVLEKKEPPAEVVTVIKSVESPTAANDNLKTLADERPSEENLSSPERDALRKAVEEVLKPKIKKAA